MEKEEKKIVKEVSKQLNIIYSYFNISKEQVENLVSLFVERGVKLKKENHDLEQYVTLNVSKSLNDEILLTQDSVLSFLHSFYESKRVNTKLIIEMNDILKLLGKSEDIDLILAIIQSNPKISSVLENSIGTGTVEQSKLDSLSSLGNFIDAYLMLYSVEVVDSSLLIDTPSSDVNSLFTLYLKDIMRFPLLSIEEEKSLALEMKNDSVAKEKFIQSNLRLVVSIAKRYTSSGVDIMDLINEGNIGLLSAASKYDPTLGYKFSTYATWSIKKAIIRAIGNKGRSIRLPISIYHQVLTVSHCQSSLLQKLGREPSVMEIAHEVNLSPNKVLYLLSLRNPVSLNDYISDGNGEHDIELEDVIPDFSISVEDRVIQSGLSEAMNSLLLTSGLTKNELFVLQNRYGLNEEEKRYSLEAISKQLDVSRERIRQIEAYAFGKLRNSIDITKFSAYLDKPDTSIQNLKDIALYQKTYKTKAHPTKEELEIFKEGFGLEEVRKCLYKGERGRKVSYRNLTNIYLFYEDYRKEDVDKAIRSLDDRGRELLEMKCGSSYQEITSIEFDDSLQAEFYVKVKRPMDKYLSLIKNDYPVTDEVYEQAIDLALSSEFSKVLELIPMESLVILLLQGGLVDKTKYSMMAISQYLHQEQGAISLKIEQCKEIIVSKNKKKKEKTLEK